MGIGGLDCLTPPKVEESPKPSQPSPFEIKYENEFNRTDIRVLENIEKLNLEGINLFKPKPAPKDKKFSLFRKKFTPTYKRQFKKIETIFNNCYIEEFVNDKFQICYFCNNNYFLDIFDNNGLFLYRIKEINGERFISIQRLIDETLLVTGKTKNYIIAIIEDKGYQILYETEISNLELRTHDEKLVCGKDSNLSLWEKNEDGIYQKTKEKYFDTGYNFVQVRDNMMATRTEERITIYEINTLEIIKIIYYKSNLGTCMGVLTENLLLMTPDYINASKRNYIALVDLNNFEIVEFKTRDVREEEEYYKRYPSASKGFPQIFSIYDAKNFPDGTLTVAMKALPGIYLTESIKRMTHYRWNNNTQDLEEIAPEVKFRDCVCLEESDKLVILNEEQYQRTVSISI